MKRIIEFFKKIKPSKRRLIQLYAALLYNAQLKGFVTGKIFTGKSKKICVPGMNCYSCPGAIGACPLGSLQNALYSQNYKTITYVVGIILLYGIIFGRTICGWLCPGGFFQELLYKIKTPKLRKNRITRVLSYFKYVLLVVLVIYIPLYFAVAKGVPLPGFCKFICPIGTFEGAVGLLSNPNNANYFELLGSLFTWKFCLMIAFIVASVFIYRFFCRFFCPLGAIYGLFNKISILGIKVDKEKCNSCGSCVSTCKMDIKEVGDHECIMCGECKHSCHAGAIDWKLISKTIKEERHGNKEAVETNTVNPNKKLIVNGIATGVMVIVLVLTIVFSNISKEDNNRPNVGNAVGDTCVSIDITLKDKEGNEQSYKIEDTRGVITIINFWYTTCTGCVNELPYFDQIQKEYEGTVRVIAVHDGSLYNSDPSDYDSFINRKKYKDYTISWAYDTVECDLYESLGGEGAYPMTVIVDENGIITYNSLASCSYESLKAEVEKILSR